MIPAFNEGKCIAEVVKRSFKQVEHVIVVDDGSKDDTAHKAKSEGAEVISYLQNKGKAYALRKGFEQCRSYDCIVILDGDLQHRPEEIPKLIGQIERGSDLCVGSRILSGAKGMPLPRRFSNWFASKIISFLINQKITDPQSGFRALRRSKLDLLELRAERYAIEHLMILEAADKGLRIDEVPISCRYSNEESDIKVIRDTLRVIYHILRFLVTK